MCRKSVWRWASAWVRRVVAARMAIAAGSTEYAVRSTTTGGSRNGVFGLSTPGADASGSPEMTAAVFGSVLQALTFLARRAKSFEIN